MQMSEFEDGYRLMSRRSHDRNVSGEFHHHIAPVHQGTRATLKPLSWRAAYRQIIPRHSHVRTFDGYLFLIKRQALDRYQRVVLTGMAQRHARGAHNSEVTRSKRVAGIFFMKMHFINNFPFYKILK